MIRNSAILESTDHRLDIQDRFPLSAKLSTRMADIVLPRTPTPGSRTRKHDANGAAQSSSWLPLATMGLTPPPSDRKQRYSQPHQSPIRKASMNANATVGMPTVDHARNMPADQLRDLICEVLPILGDVRIELAHVRLQNYLLSIEASEAAERASVEHDITRREVDILQAGSPIMQSRALLTPDPRSPLARVQRQLETAVERAHLSEAENVKLSQNLKDAKRVIKYLDGKTFDLSEDNKMLRERIRDNREHLDAYRSSGLLLSEPLAPQQPIAQASAKIPSAYTTPARTQQSRPRGSSRQLSRSVHNTPYTPARHVVSSTLDRNDAFGALLFAGEVLEQRSSMPSTPSPTRLMRRVPSHTRGALSMSSLPQTPQRSTAQADVDRFPQTDHDARRHPRARYERDETISASSEEELPTNSMKPSMRGLRGGVRGMDDDSETLPDGDLRASQASQAANDILRRNPGSPEMMRKGDERGAHAKVDFGWKRSYGSYAGDGAHMAKKAKMAGNANGTGVGLGIESWNSPGR